jgi:hypothetical protein
MTRKLVFLIAGLLCLPGTYGWAQDYSKVDIFGGYSYANFDVNDLGNRQSANGWEASAAANVNKWFAVEGGVSGYYKGYDAFDPTLGSIHANLRDYFFGGGPRLNFRPLFAHVLVGADRVSLGVGVSGLNASLSQTKFASAFGGGVQFPISHQFSLRASVDYLLTRHNLVPGTSFTQNNVRASVGIVYSFGGRGPGGASAPVPAHPPTVAAARPRAEKAPTAPETEDRQSNFALPRPSSNTVPIRSLGISARTYDNGGAQLVEVVPGSAAALAGLHSGDVINRAGDTPIRSAMELMAVLKDQAAGTKIRLGFLVRGLWQTEMLVVLGEDH